MSLYADLPGLRIRQVAGDVLVLAWVALCVLIGRSVHDVLAAAAVPLRRVAEVGTAIEDGMDDAGRGAGEVPLVGDRLRLPFEQVATSGGQLRRAGSDAAALVDSTAMLVGVLVALLPALFVLVPWVAVRLRYARRAGSVRRLARQAGGTDLLALRALVGQPHARLTSVSPQPVKAWRAADPVVVAQLAELELARWGVQPSRTGPDAPGPAEPPEV